MAENRKYKVIISDTLKEMLKSHISYIAQINKSAAAAKKKEIMVALRSLAWMPQRFPFFEEIYISLSKQLQLADSFINILISDSSE